MGDQLVTIVVPAYGAGTAVNAVIRDIAVAAYALETRGYQVDVIAVGEPATADAACKVAAEYRLDCEPLIAESLGEAYLAGLRTTLERDRANLVVTLDATGEHDASQLPRLIDEMVERKLDVIIGSRWAFHSGTPGLTLRRWALGRLANRSFRAITGIRGITDSTTAFRVVTMNVLQCTDLSLLPAEPRVLQMALVADAVAKGYRVGEGAIIYRSPAKVTPITAADLRSFLRSLLSLRKRVRDVRNERLSPTGRHFVHSDFGAAGDLEKLGTADRFFGWTLDNFRPYLSGRVLEVGAGLGTISRKLVESNPDLTVVALEPADNLFDGLSAIAAVNPRVKASQLLSGEYLEKTGEKFDTVLYLNVLEHIDDELEELRTTSAALRPGGHLLVFGPALPWLYSELDYNAGHYRRYTVSGLRKVVQAAGLEVVSLRYFDVLGVLPYFVVYKLMRSQAISGSTMWGYDRVLVPLSRLLQAVLRRPPLGKNVILVARKAVTPD